MKGKKNNFIIIDDDPINNMVCEQIILEALPSADVQIFTRPEAAIAYMLSLNPEPGAGTTILFLDINMPEISGWEVLDEFNGFPSAIKKHFEIYMLSSSVDPHDKQKAAEYPVVLGYIEKPLTITQVQAIVANAGKLA